MKALKKLLAVAALSLPLATFAQEAAKPAEPPKADPPKISVTPYGIIYMGLVKNDGTFALTEYPAYVTSEDEGAMVISARQTRFGVNVNAPMENVLGATLTGKIEFDFMGAGSSAFTNANMRLRHAFVSAVMAAGPGKFAITAGQTDGLLNPLHPESTTYLALPMFQQAGNLHRRTGQLRLGYDFAGEAFGLKVEAGLFNPTNAGTAGSTDQGYLVGNRSGMADIEARAGFTLKPISGIGGAVGVSYNMGTRTYTGATAGTTEDVDASALGVDFMLDLTKYVHLRGEYFMGEGIDDSYAGIATTSVNATTLKGVESSGYWVQAVLKPHAVIHLLAGLGNETVDEATYPASAAAQRMQNDMMHFGLLLNMNKAWRVGVEYVSTTTKSRPNDTAAGADLTASQMSLSTQLRF
jgi:hypothetical protein